MSTAISTSHIAPPALAPLGVRVFPRRLGHQAVAVVVQPIDQRPDRRIVLNLRRGRYSSRRDQHPALAELLKELAVVDVETQPLGRRVEVGPVDEERQAVRGVEGHRLEIPIMSPRRSGGQRLEGETGAGLDDAVVVALGSNLAGEFASSEALLEAALARFPQAGLPVLARSGWWSSAAWPDPKGPEYRNGVAACRGERRRPKPSCRRFFPSKRRSRETGGRGTPPARSISTSSPMAGRSSMPPASPCRIRAPISACSSWVRSPRSAPGWRHPVLGLTAPPSSPSPRRSAWDARPA